MGRLVAIIFVLWFAWVSYPHLARGEWLAPTPLPPEWWAGQYAQEYQALATPSVGYGWYRFDAWNNPPKTGRQVTQDDFSLYR